MKTIALALALAFSGVHFSHAHDEDQCEYDENSVDEAVGEAIEAFREKLKECMNKASTLEAIRACGDIDE
jgi:hypothetical protein